MTARDVWTTLQKTYGRVDIMAQFSLRDHVNNLKLKDHNDLDCYIGEFRNAKLRFIQMGVPFTEHEMVHAILSGLPSLSHWPHFHQLMTQMVQDHIDRESVAVTPAIPDALLNRIIARLVIECQRLQSAPPVPPHSNTNPIPSFSITAQPEIAASASLSLSPTTQYHGDLSC